jgi:hypothetical protein
LEGHYAGLPTQKRPTSLERYGPELDAQLGANSAGLTSPDAGFAVARRLTAGKARVAQNARRHGLNTAVADDPALAADVEALAATGVMGEKP